MRPDDPSPDSAARAIERLTRHLRELELRVAALESGGAAAAETAEPAPRPAESESFATPLPGAESVELLPLIGRTLLVLAGAFVLRAITETGALQQAPGAVIGLAYSLVWFFLADRAVRHGQRASAVFHGLAGSIIAMPLLVEATARFEVFSAPLAALILAALLAFGLGIPALRGLHPLAWIVGLGGAVTLLALAVSTHSWILFVTLLLALALAGLWLGYVRGWRNLGWVLAAILDLTMLLLAIVAWRAEPEKVAELFHPAALVALQLAVVIGYFGSFFARTSRSGQQVSLGETVQGLAVLPLCLGGALVIVERTEVVAWLPGLAAAVLAAASYAAAFAVMDRALGRRRNFVFYSTAALVFTLTAAVTLLRGPALVYSLAVLAVAAAWLGGKRERATLSLHAGLYLVAAAAGAGIPMPAIDALTGPSTPTAEWIGLPVLAVVLAGIVSCWFPVATHGRTLGLTLARFPKATILAVLAVALGGIAATLGARLLPHGEAGQIDMATLAPLRTLILAAAAILLAWLSGRPRIREAGWLVYPILLAGGVHLVMEDLRSGRPLTLVVSFVLYGGALILSPGLMRRGRRADAAGSAADEIQDGRGPA